MGTKTVKIAEHPGEYEECPICGNDEARIVEGFPALNCTECDRNLA